MIIYNQMLYKCKCLEMEKKEAQCGLFSPCESNKYIYTGNKLVKRIKSNFWFLF